MRTFFAAIALAATMAVTSLASTRAHASCGNQTVVVFDADWCAFCKKVKAMLSRQGIPYRSIDTTNNGRARAFMAERFGTTMIPVTVIDNAYVIGFNERRLRELLCIG